MFNIFIVIKSVTNPILSPHLQLKRILNNQKNLPIKGFAMIILWLDQCERTSFWFQDSNIIGGDAVGLRAEIGVMCRLLIYSTCKMEFVFSSLP